MRNLRAFRLEAVIACVLASLSHAQQNPAEVEAALRRWEMSSGKEAKERVGALAALSGFEDPRVTEALVSALERQANDDERVRIVEAIGKKPRAQAAAVAALQEALSAKASSPKLRNSAALALARQGNRGIDLLIGLANSEADDVTDAIRLASCVGLAGCNEDRAWRGLAPLALKGAKAEQLAVLRLLVPAKGVKAVTQARIKLLQESDHVLVAMAWRQLADEGYERAEEALDALLLRMDSSIPEAARVELVHGLGGGLLGLSPEEFLRIAASSSSAVHLAVVKEAPRLAKEPKLLAFLVEVASKRADENERAVALAVVGKASNEALAPHIGRIRSRLADPTRDDVELALAAMAVLSKDPAWKDDLRRLVGASDPQLVATGLALMLDFGMDDSIAVAQQQLKSSSWALRSVCYRYLSRFRAVASIPFLIERFGKEDGRLDAELDQSLLLHTGARHLTREDWESWWKANQSKHELPHMDTVASSRKKQQASTSNSTVSYYGIPLVSKQCVFLVDASGSMAEKVGTDKKRTRYDEARRQLLLAVEKLPDDQRFNVFFYSTGVNAMWPELRTAQGEDRTAVLERIKASNFTRGSTNIFDSLEQAFRDAQVDTIYLLSDGEPSAGRVTDPTQIADLVRRWNYSRQVVIHCVSVGAKSKLMERLASESGGKFVWAR